MSKRVSLSIALGISVLSALVIAAFLIRDFIALPPAFIFSLALLSIGLYLSYRYYRQKKSIINGLAIVIAAYTVTYPLSAVIHLVGTNGDRRGFLDLVRPALSDSWTIHYSVILMGIALLSLYCGMSHADRCKRDWANPIQLGVLPMFVFGILFTILGVVGTVRLFADANSLASELATLDRTREIGGGLARYFFMSRWLQWGLAFLSVGIIRTLKRSPKLFSYSFITVSVVIILLNSFPSGGRSEGILGVLPLLFLIVRLEPSFAPKIGRFSIPTLLIYMGYITILRTDNYPSDGGGLINVLDWQIGRFSMIGAGIEMVDKFGYALGSTLLAGITSTINAPFVLLKISLPVPEPYGVTNFVGMHLKGDPRVTGIVPGTVCELYFNFGLVGVIMGYLLIGRLTAFCTTRIRETNSLGTVAVLSYILVLICTAIIPGTTTTWIYLFFTHGFPALCLFLYEKLLRREAQSHCYAFRLKDRLQA
jgi:hypothetical protein